MAREIELGPEKQAKADQIFMSATIQTPRDGILYGVGIQGAQSKIGFVYGTRKIIDVTIPTSFNPEEWVLLEADRRHDADSEPTEIGRKELIAELAKFDLTIEEVAKHYYPRALEANRVAS